MKQLKHKSVSKKFKGGGYFKSEEIEPGITVMEMDGKGFVKEFLNPKELKMHQLMEQFMKENPMVLDEQIPDAFDRWLSEHQAFGLYKS